MLLRSGLHSEAIMNIDLSNSDPASGSSIGLDLLSAESPVSAALIPQLPSSNLILASQMLDIQGSYMNLDEILDSPTATPVRSRH